ncbi:MAG: hypothetical protein K2N16_05240, partial [Muribaculaceae bacterium]|nr:hypothetical protein [Muribaculaceae bacterium]
MKRLFTLAVVALIATMAFAQSQPAQRRVAYTTVQHAMQVGQLGPKAYADALAKADAAKEFGSTRLVRATNPAAGYQQLSKNGGNELGQLSLNDDRVLTGTKVSKPVSNAPYKAPAKVTETEGNLTITKDAHGIITNVEGVEPQIYTRANTGIAYYSSNGSMAMAAQSGNATIIVDGNNVYMLNPISRYTQGTWVKGVKNGNTITVATKQPLAYNTNYGTTISLRWGVITAAGNINNADSHADAFTFTINGDVITLEGTQAYDQTADAYYMGTFWDDDNTAAGYGDAETVLTLNSNYTPPSTELVTLPAGVTAEGWYLSGTKVNSSAQTPVTNQNVKVAFTGNDVYVQGLFTAFPNSWVKGTKNGNTYEFANFQFLGTYGTNNLNIWAVGYDGSALSGYKATYNATAKTLTFNMAVLANAAEDRVYYLDWLQDVVISAEAEETPELVTPPAGVTAESWYLNGTQVDSENLTPVTNQNVKVAFTGNDVYVQGLFTDFPTSWIKGTKSGNNYVFANLQYVGDFSSYNIFVVGLTENGDEVSLTDFSAAYNASAKTLTFDRPILANASKTEIYYLDWIQDVVISAEAGEEPLLNTQTATLPYVNTFDTPEEQAQVAIYDANGDNKTFTFDKDTSTGSTVAKYTYSSSNTANDYMVFPAVQLKAGKTYVISLEARANGTTYEEKVSVLCGPDSRISSMTTEVIPVTTLNKTEYVTLTNSEFTVTETGMYNFAIKACSDPDKFYLYVDNFSIKEINDNAPAAPTDVVVTPDATGANKATVTLTAPSKNLVGTPLTGVLNMVIKVDGEQAVAKQVTTGAAVNEEITVEAPGFYNVTVEFSCAAGVADPVTVKAYIGIDVPAEPDNFTLVDKNTSIAMSWTAPQEGVNGAPFFPEDLVYNIYPVEMVEFWGMVFPSIDYDNPYATGVSGTSYDLEYNTNEGQQAYTFFGLAAENVAGEGEGIYKAMLTGAPYTLPVKESLAGGSLGYWWGSDCDNNNYSLEGGLYAGDNASDGDGYCLEFQGMTKGWVFLKSGKIALAGAANPVYQFDAVKTLGTVTLDVYVETSEGKTKVKTIEPTDEYATYTVSLADYKDAVWVSVILQANFEGYADQSGNPIAIVDVDNIQIYNQLDHNLAVVGINAPAKVTAGNDVVAKVTVENQGSLDVAAADYTVKFIVNGEEHVVAGVDIASNEKVEFEYSFPTNAASPAAYAIKAEVVYAADEDKANNTSAEINVVVAQPNYPTVANVAAAVEGNAVTLTWDEPNLEDIAPEAVTEDFESYEPFQFGDAIGEWTLVDLDGTAMGGMQNTDVPNLTIGETTGSYFVLNRETISTHESFDAKSGVQYLSTMFA